VACNLIVYSHYSLSSWLFPYIGRNVSVTGLFDGVLLHGDRPVLLSKNLRFILSTVNSAGLLCFLAVLCSPEKTGPCSEADTRSRAQDTQTYILLAPFSIAYILLLLSRTPFQEMYDRYLYPLIFIALLMLLRIHQQRISPRLPVLSWLLVIGFGGYSLAATHDTFAIYRARLAAVNELRAAGISATAIDGGFEYNAWTQINTAGHMNERRIQVPANAYQEIPAHVAGECYPFLDVTTPAVSGQFALSFDPNACLGNTGFQAVTFHPWLGPHTSHIYIVDARRP
jgi:hypothetical protein